MSSSNKRPLIYMLESKYKNLTKLQLALLLSMLTIFGAPSWNFALSELVAWSPEQNIWIAKNNPVAELLRDFAFVPALITTIIFFPGVRRVIAGVARPLVLLIVMMFVTLLFHSISIQNITSIAFSFIFFYYALFFVVVFSIQDRQFIHLLSSSICICLLGALFFAFAQGSEVPRYIGAIHPNIAGGISVAVVAIAFYAQKRLFLIFLTLAVFFSIMASSRFAMLGCFIVAFSYFYRPNLRYFSLSFFALYLVLLLESMTGGRAIGRLFAIFDPDRGIGSGFTGRSDLWENLSAQLEFLGGVGFRNRSAYDGAHSGLMNTMIEIGLVFSIFFFLLIIAFICFGLLKGDKSRTHEKRMAASIFLVWIIIGIFQPQILSFGDPQGMLIFVLFGFVARLVRAQTSAINPSVNSRRGLPDSRIFSGRRPPDA